MFDDDNLRFTPTAERQDFSKGYSSEPRFSDDYRGDIENFELLSLVSFDSILDLKDFKQFLKELNIKFEIREEKIFFIDGITKSFLESWNSDVIKKHEKESKNSSKTSEVKDFINDLKNKEDW